MFKIRLFDPQELFLDYDYDNYLLSRAIVLPWLGMTFLYGMLMARRKFRQITRINYLPRMNSFEFWTYHTFSKKVDSYLVPAKFIRRSRDPYSQYNNIHLPLFVCGKPTFFTYGEKFWRNKLLFKAVIRETNG